MSVRILTRYILKEIASHALIGVALFTFIIFMRDLGKLLELIVRNSAPLPSVAEIFLFTLPATFIITLPMGVLVGILVGLSRLAADSEVTAIRASGMGVGMFVRSVAIFAIGAWLLGMVNSIYIAPDSAIALDHLQDRLKASQASFEIQPRVFYEDFKNIVLYVQDAIPTKGQALWRGIFLADITDPASPKITLAQRGALLRTGQTSCASIWRTARSRSRFPRSRISTRSRPSRTPRFRSCCPADESKPHDLSASGGAGPASLVAQCRPRAPGRAEVLSLGHGQLQLRPDQGAILRD